MKTRLLQTALCCLLFLPLFVTNSIAQAQEGTVNSRLSADTITRDEAVTLEIVAIGLDKELDLSSLEKDFDVTGRSSSREVNSMLSASGELRTTSIVTWSVQLLPKDIGVFTVPAVRVGDISSQTHTLTVNDLPKGAQRDIFIVAEVDTSTPWVQSQVLMTLKIFQGIEIVDGSLDIPESDNLIVERLGEDERSTETHDGRLYSVTTRRLALFPQKSGEMTLNPITLSVSVQADSNRVRTFFSPTRKLTRRTDKLLLDVKPRPDKGAAWWLPAKGVQLDSQWSGDVDQATVDQPLTRSITLRASGVADSQLPDINMPAVEGASMYAEQPVRKLGANEQGLISELTLKWALIPQRVGQLTLPPVVVEWFDTSTGKMQNATIPSETIEVTTNQARVGPVQPPQSLPNVSNSNDSSIASFQPTVSEQAAGGEVSNVSKLTPVLESRIEKLQSEVFLWRSLLTLVLVVWLVSAVIYWWVKSRSANYNEGDSKKRNRLKVVRNATNSAFYGMQPLDGFTASCKRGDLAAIRSVLIEWSGRQWPESPPLSLTGIAKRLPQGPAKVLTNELDAALYSPQGKDQSVEPLLLRLQKLPKELKISIDPNDEKNASKGVESGHGLPAL